MYSKNLLLLILVSFMFFEISFAQRKRPDPSQWPSFSVGPLNIQITGRPGQNVKGTIKLITRNYNKSANFTIDVMDLGQTIGNSPVPVKFGEGTRSCSDWINIQNELQVLGNEQVEIPFTIQMPRDVQGSYFSFINISSKADKPTGDFVVLVNYRLPVKIELSVPGQALLRINTSNFKFASSNMINKPSLSFQLKNEGFWKTNIEGDIILRHLSSGNQQNIRIPSGPYGKPLVVYPGLEIPVKCDLPNSLNPGTYSANVRIIMNSFAKTQSHFEFTTSINQITNGKMKSKEEFDLKIEVYPPIIEMPVIPGAVRHIPLRIMNKNNIPIKIYLSLQKTDIEIDGNFTYLGETENKYASAIELSDTLINIEPMKTGIIKTKIEVPNDIEKMLNTTNVLRIIAKRKEENIETINDWGSMGEFSIPVLVYDAKSEPAKLECSSFEILPKDKEKNPEMGILRIKNVGERIGNIKGKMSLKKTGREYAYLDIGLIKTELILPGKEREFRFEIPPLDNGQFELSATIYFVKRQREVALFAENSFRITPVIPTGLR